MKNLLIRSASGLIYVFLIVFSLFISTALFWTVLLVLSFLCLVEFQKLIHHKSPLAFVALILLFYGLFAHWEFPYRLYFLILICAVNTLLAAWLLFSSKTTFTFFEKGALSLLYIVGSAYFIAVLAPSQILMEVPDILIFFILIWVNNSVAYLVGNLLGKNLLLSKISPKKTWEGFWGGAIFCILAAILMHLYIAQTKQPLWVFLSLAAISVLLGTLGDLVQSRFKRIAGVKDSGRLMPGHGGFFDRMDSILFSAPLLYAYLKLVEYVS